MAAPQVLYRVLQEQDIPEVREVVAGAFSESEPVSGRAGARGHLIDLQDTPFYTTAIPKSGPNKAFLKVIRALFQDVGVTEGGTC